MSFDPDAANAFISAAASAAALLTDSGAHADIAAAADLSGLGSFGADFAAAWSAAWTGHADTVRVAAGLLGEYGQVVDTFAKQVTGIDTDVAGVLGAIGEQVV